MVASGRWAAMSRMFANSSPGISAARRRHSAQSTGVRSAMAPSHSRARSAVSLRRRSSSRSCVWAGSRWSGTRASPAPSSAPSSAWTLPGAGQSPASSAAPDAPKPRGTIPGKARAQTPAEPGCILGPLLQVTGTPSRPLEGGCHFPPRRQAECAGVSCLTPSCHGQRDGDACAGQSAAYVVARKWPLALPRGRPWLTISDDRHTHLLASLISPR